MLGQNHGRIKKTIKKEHFYRINFLSRSCFKTKQKYNVVNSFFYSIHEENFWFKF